MSIPLACDLSAIPAAQRQQHIQLAQALMGGVQAVEELPDGYALRLAQEADILPKVAHYIRNERLCCPFFQFNVRVAGQEVWLSLTGADPVKTFLQAELGAVLKPTGV